MLINVRAKAGRIARTAPDGEFIPHDVYIPVFMSRYVERLLKVHGDIEVEPKAPEKTATAKKEG